MTILAKVYSDEEIERLSNNPHVNHVSRHRLSLTLDFKQYMYDIWVERPVASTIKKLLLENGFDTRELGKDFYKNISNAFRHWGRPQRVHGPAYNAVNVKSPMVSKKLEADTINGSVVWSHSDESYSGHGTDPDTYIRSGKFVRKGESIELSPDYVSALFASYPETTIYEALSRSGFTTGEIGSLEICKLEKFFSMCRMAGTSPFESRENNCLLKNDEVEAVRKNPFVETVSPSSICMRKEFWMAAAIFREVPVDRILDIFMLGHRNYTLPEKTRIKELLGITASDLKGIDAFGNTVYDSRILARRIAALERMAKEGFRRLSSFFPSLKPYQKKQVCQWIQGIPSDPGNVFTRKAVLQEIGITRSIYYLYIGDPDFGMGEIRKKEQDEADARLVKMAIDYKGFRKGSRQIYMLIPRLTGKHISLKRIRGLMKAYGLECGIRKPNASREGRNAYEKEAVKPDILRRRFRLYRPNKVRVTDVTYMDYGDKDRAYGSALMDPVTGRLVAFVVSGSNNLEMAIETLRVSDRHPCEDGGIFHSDQGTLYKSATFQEEILERGLRQSMSKKGNCWDNATQESFFGHFKDECDYKSCRSIQELKKMVEEYSWYYNNERGMWDKGRMTPAEYEEYLLGLDEGQFERYLAAEEKKYNEMKEKAAALAKKRYGTLGV